MNGFLKYFILLGILFFHLTACETSNNNTPTTPPETAETPPKKSTPDPLPQKDCEIKGKVLEGNQMILKQQNTLVCILADESTKDEKKGDSHRILEIYNTQTCDLVKRETLPINISSDFPYQIADIIYNKNSSLVAIKGYGLVYCYDVKNQKLLDPLVPDFLSERIASDAQSGSIKHLEVWENYLIGYAEDIGAFVFDLTNIDQPKAMLPSAEFDLSFGESEDFSSLFFLKSQNGSTHQAILPNYDFDEEKFNINPLFSTPQNVNATIPKNVKNNRFIILKNQSGTSFAIDMEAQKNVNLPDNLQGKPTQEILKWLKKL